MADCPYLGKTPPSPAAGQAPAPAPAAPAAAPARQMGGDRNGMAGLLLTEPAIVLEGVCLVSSGQNTTAQKEAEHIIPPVPSQNWIVDTGSTNCNTLHRELLHDYQPLNETVRVVGGRTLQVEGMGTLHLVILTAQGPHTLVVREVRHVPGSVYNLLSGHALHTQKVASFCFQHDQPHGELRLPSPTADKLGKLLIEVPWVNGCYTLMGDPIKTDPEVSLVSTAVKEQRAAQHLHEALGHPSNEILARGLEKGSVTGVVVNPAAIRNLPKCEDCLQAKQTKGSFGAETAGSHFTMYLGMKGSAGSHFTMYLGMKGSGYSVVMLLKSKEADEVVPLIIQLQKWFERQSGHQTKVIRSDRGREFFNSQLSEYCLNLGIRQEAYAAHCPEQNGIAERLNITLLEKVRAQLLNSGMHHKWWGECLRYSVNQLNCIPSSVLPIKVTPFEALFGYPPNISKFQPFETVAFVLKLPRHADGAGKLDQVSLKGRLVGFSNVSKAYRVLVEGHGVIESCHVRFVADSDNEVVVDVGTQTGQLDQPHEADADIIDITGGSPDLFTNDTTDMPAADIDDNLMHETEVAIRRSNRPSRSPNRLNLVNLSNKEEKEAPRNYNEAKRRKDALRGVGTYKLAVAAEKGMHIHQMDVKSAFLNSELDDEVYIRLPPEVCIGGDKVVYKLKKAVYGLKQAPRAWYNRLKEILTGLGFTQSEADPAMYFQAVNGQLEVILTHVDDLLIASADLDRVQWIKHPLKQQVDIKDMGPASYYLAMEISRRDGRIHLTQKKYTKELLDRFAPMGLWGRESPLEDKLQLSRKEGERLCDKQAARYRETVGGLMYLQTGTRPDLAHAVGMLARFFQAPTILHMDALTSVMRYVESTQYFGLEFGGVKDPGLVDYVDSSYSSDPDTRRSTTGYVFLYNGGAVSWGSRL
ncbi:hypothetical protein CEUSTIGMA_g2364.t1 [Chlamydomonas eustigma]|uniref:Integrase catalytic domain-containing protein n=1 Tax=Chlamydomonas eustigma TaxID=1157962 RepID=A0A250WVR3_9CHLO|nr:hypothetical protein CEUSTIGMA_g2364.t1 [Chlamydomonas eustigma]|eukprot:GAX74918.1 hypothetical protein CEUSTIGMA_g2364.t1 [Chlamydomonas eustigma]